MVFLSIKEYLLLYLNRIDRYEAKLSTFRNCFDENNAFDDNQNLHNAESENNSKMNFSPIELASVTLIEDTAADNRRQQQTTHVCSSLSSSSSCSNYSNNDRENKLEQLKPFDRFDSYSNVHSSSMPIYTELDGNIYACLT